MRKMKPRVRSALAIAICKYLNEHFDGNVSRAAATLDCPYDPLRNMALGIAMKPNLTVLQQLAVHSGKSIDSWVTL